MTRSSQQTYIQRLGFQDKDRSNPRHGLACEYLLDRLIQRELIGDIQRLKDQAVNEGKERRERRIGELKYSLKDNEIALKHGWHSSESMQESTQQLTREINRLQIEIDRLPQIADAVSNNEIASDIYKLLPSSSFISAPIANGKFINGFADVLFDCFVRLKFQDGMAIKPVIDRSNYRVILGEIKITQEPAENIIQQIAFYRQFVDAKEVIILVDYDAPQLKRMTSGSDIHVYRLGSKFDAWCAAKAQPHIEEF